MEQFFEAEVIDAQHLKLKKPIKNSPGTTVIITIKHSGKIEGIAENQEWFFIASRGLDRAYGEDEPNYSLDKIKEPNPEYQP